MNKKLKYIILFIILVIYLLFVLNINNYFKMINSCFNKNIVVSVKMYVLICLIFALILIFMTLDIYLVFSYNKTQNKGLNIKKEDLTYGSSNWLEDEEIKNILGDNLSKGIILGKHNNEIIKLPFDSFFNKNICVFGSSRQYENNTVSYLQTY